MSVFRTACPRCRGLGVLNDCHETPPAKDVEETASLCPTCRGKGQLDLEADESSLTSCERCQGTGTLGGGTKDPVCARCFGCGYLVGATRPRILF